MTTFERLETTEDKAFVPLFSNPAKGGGWGRNLRLGPTRLSLTDDPGP